ncbi:hypothetical protein IM793_11550 [Pedobacter sp. MR2016-19]|nr:hypothetical protein [Pedobacter sp. MR2016-19]MBE5319796.1 hypothetical protein [Pedobacter sp. MR2016-19]
MQGINKGKHEQLQNALVQLSNLLENEQEDKESIQQAIDYQKKLEYVYSDYQKKLADLEQVVIEYEVFYAHVKAQFLTRKLKELKKEIRTKQPAYGLLAENIRLSYGT